VDEWIKLNHIINSHISRPTNPTQEEAYGLCQKKDHSWITDERFIGNAGTTTRSTELKNSLVKISIKYKCYFCGYEKTEPLR
jgi:hypothetical protein